MPDLTDYPALQRHLLAVHCNGAGLTLTDAEAAEQHHDEHHGPGGLRNHDENSLHWDPVKANEILASHAEGDPEALAELLRRADVSIAMTVDEHAHGYALGEGWTVCPEGEHCQRFPRDVDASETRTFDGRLRNAHCATIKTREDLIARGMLNGLSALLDVNLLATDPTRSLSAHGDQIAALSEKARTQLRHSLVHLRPMLYPEG